MSALVADSGALTAAAAHAEHLEAKASLLLDRLSATAHRTWLDALAQPATATHHRPPRNGRACVPEPRTPDATGP